MNGLLDQEEILKLHIYLLPFREVIGTRYKLWESPAQREHLGTQARSPRKAMH